MVGIELQQVHNNHLYALFFISILEKNRGFNIEARVHVVHVPEALLNIFGVLIEFWSHIMYYSHER